MDETGRRASGDRGGELLREAQEVDKEEDHRHKRSKRGDELPQELAFRESRLSKIREAKKALEAEVRLEAEKAKAAGKEQPGVPEDKAQRNFSLAQTLGSRLPLW